MPLAVLALAASLTATLHAAPYVPILHEGDTVADTALVDQSARPVRLAQYRNGILVISFMYARCPDPDQCSLTSAKFAQIQRRVRRERIHLIEITLDAAHDTPRVLARYGRSFGADPHVWTLASGDPATIARLAARFDIVRTRAASIVHADDVILLDPRGRVYDVLAGDGWSADDVIAQARAGLGTTPGFGARVIAWLRSDVAAVCGGPPGFSNIGTLALFVALLFAAALLAARLFLPKNARR